MTTTLEKTVETQKTAREAASQSARIYAHSELTKEQIAQLAFIEGAIWQQDKELERLAQVREAYRKCEAVA